jgi:hypothetical protein
MYKPGAGAWVRRRLCPDGESSARKSTFTAGKTSLGEDVVGLILTFVLSSECASFMAVCKEAEAFALTWEAGIKEQVTMVRPLVLIEPEALPDEMRLYLTSEESCDHVDFTTALSTLVPLSNAFSLRPHVWPLTASTLRQIEIWALSLESLLLLVNNQSQYSSRRASEYDAIYVLFSGVESPHDLYMPIVYQLFVLLLAVLTRTTAGYECDVIPLQSASLRQGRIQLLVLNVVLFSGSHMLPLHKFDLIWNPVMSAMNRILPHDIRTNHQLCTDVDHAIRPLMHHHDWVTSDIVSQAEDFLTDTRALRNFCSIMQMSPRLYHAETIETMCRRLFASGAELLQVSEYTNQLLFPLALAIATLHVLTYLPMVAMRPFLRQCVHFMLQIESLPYMDGQTMQHTSAPYTNPHHILAVLLKKYPPEILSVVRDEAIERYACAQELFARMASECGLLIVGSLE